VLRLSRGCAPTWDEKVRSSGFFGGKVEEQDRLARLDHVTFIDSYGPLAPCREARAAEKDGLALTKEVPRKFFSWDFVPRQISEGESVVLAYFSSSRIVNLRKDDDEFWPANETVAHRGEHRKVDKGGAWIVFGGP